MESVYEESLKLHQSFHGKLEIKSKVALENKQQLSLAYTPGVAQVSIEIGRDPLLAKEYTIKRNTVAVVSDGSAILGLGNLGAKAAIPVMEGKAVLFKQFGNVDAFPICLDTQDPFEIISIVKAIAPVFGGINLEDISAPRCFEIEAELRKLDIPVMHDDQHGTAVVVLAALINILKLRGLEKDRANIVINGAGAAGNAVTNLLIAYGFKNIIVCDSKGIISKDRTGLERYKQTLANATNLDNKSGLLADALLGADVFIGLSKAGLLSEQMVKSMHQNPIIMALANPVPEIMPEIAKKAGAFIVATGRSDYPNQINNVLAFPGIFRGALDNNIVQFTQGMFLKAAKTLASCVEELSTDKILPSVFELSVAKKIAAVIQ